MPLPFVRVMPFAVVIALRTTKQIHAQCTACTTHARLCTYVRKAIRLFCVCTFNASPHRMPPEEQIPAWNSNKRQYAWSDHDWQSSGWIPAKHAKAGRGGIQKRVALDINMLFDTGVFDPEVFVQYAKEKLADYAVPLPEDRVQFCEAWFDKTEDEKEAVLYSPVGVNYAIWNKKVVCIREERKEAFELFFANSVDANDNADVDDVEADE